MGFPIGAPCGRFESRETSSNGVVGRCSEGVGKVKAILQLADWRTVEAMVPFGLSVLRTPFPRLNPSSTDDVISPERGDPRTISKVLSIDPTYLVLPEVMSGDNGLETLTPSNCLAVVTSSRVRRPPSFRILTEWMPNGNVTRYARFDPEENWLRFVSPLAVYLLFLSRSRLALVV